jgi:peroxiredoxin
MKYLPIEDPAVPFDAWFRDETGLVEEIRLDLTQLAQEMEGTWNDNATYLFSLRFQNVKLNEPVRADRFVFKPAPGDTKTEEFEVPPGPDRKEMIGKPAPAFSAKDMSGSELRLSDLAGSVVVLDFWATWCRGCVPGLLKLQKLADKYAGRPVSVVGINGDEPGSAKRVAGFLASRNIRFRQVVDLDSRISDAYRVSGLPHTVLIDQGGMIRAVHFGLLPEKKLSSQIDRMLQDGGRP